MQIYVKNKKVIFCQACQRPKGGEGGEKTNEVRSQVLAKYIAQCNGTNIIKIHRKMSLAKLIDCC